MLQTEARAMLQTEERTMLQTEEGALLPTQEGTPLPTEKRTCGALVCGKVGARVSVTGVNGLMFTGPQGLKQWCMK